MLMPANRILALIIVAATVSLTVGVLIERGRESGETHGEAGHVEVVGPGGESGETGVEGSEIGAHADASGEKLLGIDPESIPLLIVAIAVSLALAGAVWLRPDAAKLMIVTALAMAAFAALDIREFVHQIDASRGGLAVLAGAVVLLHAAAAILAVWIERDRVVHAAPHGAG